MERPNREAASDCVSKGIGPIQSGPHRIGVSVEDTIRLEPYKDQLDHVTPGSALPSLRASSLDQRNRPVIIARDTRINLVKTTEAVHSSDRESVLQTSNVFPRYATPLNA